LTVGGKPILQWVVEECLEAGAEQVVVVGSTRKPEVDAFVTGLQDERVSVVHQPEPLGLADAVRRGLSSGKAALVPMPDYLFLSANPSKSLASAVCTGAYGAVAASEVALERVSMYGIVGIARNGTVTAIVEKPAPAQAPSRWAVTGRFALSIEAAEELARTDSAYTNLSELFAAALKKGLRIEAHRTMAGEAFDCGDPEGYRAAAATLGR
jgi:UTP--glucose-1-phosphate uridylyltransferase